MAHNVKKLACGCSLERFTEVVRHLQGMLERFMEVLSCLDQCFVGATTLEELPVATQVGQTRVGGIDVNRPRMRWVLQAVLALAPGTGGSPLRNWHSECESSVNKVTPVWCQQAAYDLKKLRGKQMVHRMKNTRRYEAMREGLRAMAALLVLRDKVLRPCWPAAQPLEPSRGAHNPTAIDRHYEVIRNGMQGVFQELGLVA